MKKPTLLLLAIFLQVFASAQDIIVTKNQERIDAEILEVSQTEIRYKKASNPTGPTFVIDKNEISTLLFKNGEVEILDQTKFSPNDTITKIDNVYFFKGQKMSKYEFLNFIEKNSQEAFQYYLHGQKLWRAGWITFGVGVGADILGTVLFFQGIYTFQDIYNPEFQYVNPHLNDVPLGLTVSSAFLMTLGGAATLASIPVICVGAYKRRNAHEVYNKFAKKSDISLNFQAKSNGFGLALNF